MNDAMCSNGSVRSRLVVGIVQRLPILNTDFTRQLERMTMISKSQAEMNSVIDETIYQPR